MRSAKPPSSQPSKPQDPNPLGRLDDGRLRILLARTLMVDGLVPEILPEPVSQRLGVAEIVVICQGYCGAAVAAGQLDPVADCFTIPLAICPIGYGDIGNRRKRHFECRQSATRELEYLANGVHD